MAQLRYLSLSDVATWSREIGLVAPCPLALLWERKKEGGREGGREDTGQIINIMTPPQLTYYTPSQAMHEPTTVSNPEHTG